MKTLEEMKESVDTLDELEYFATLGTSNFGGIVIAVTDCGEGVFVQDVWDSGHSEIELKEIEYKEIKDDDVGEEEGEDQMVAGFNYNDHFYRLDEFIRHRSRG